MCGAAIVVVLIMSAHDLETQRGSEEGGKDAYEIGKEFQGLLNVGKDVFL
jgi:hypothetical protein